MQFLVAQCAFEVRFIKMKQLYENFNFSPNFFRAPSGRDISKITTRCLLGLNRDPQWIYLTYILSY